MQTANCITLQQGILTKKAGLSKFRTTLLSLESSGTEMTPHSPPPACTTMEFRFTDWSLVPLFLRSCNTKGAARPGKPSPQARCVPHLRQRRAGRRCGAAAAARSRRGRRTQRTRPRRTPPTDAARCNPHRSPPATPDTILTAALGSPPIPLSKTHHACTWSCHNEFFAQNSSKIPSTPFVMERHTYLNLTCEKN